MKRYEHIKIDNPALSNLSISQMSNELCRVNGEARMCAGTECMDCDFDPCETCGMKCEEWLDEEI